MNKKGDVPWILVMFALALVVLVVAIVLVVGKSTLFRRGSEQAVEPIYKCLCIPPGSSNVCAADNPDTTNYGSRTVPSDCATGWEDCSTNCWGKT